MASEAADWPRLKVRAALLARGLTLTALAKRDGRSVAAFSLALGGPYPSIERVIADALDLDPWDIWPSRYHEDGSPRRNYTLERPRRGAKKKRGAQGGR